jgi:hypothetical protein
MRLDCGLLILSLAGALDALLPHSQQQPLKTEEEVGDWFSSKSFDAFVASVLETWHVPGLSIAIVEGDKIYSKVPTHNIDSQAPANPRIGLWLCPTPEYQSNARYPLFHRKYHQGIHSSCRGSIDS